MTPIIIADIGSNHRGQLELALKSIEIAKECGCDAVKFQLFTHEELYGVPGTMSHAFQADWFPKLSEMARDIEIEFMCSAFSPMGVGMVEPYVLRHKLASSEFTDVSIIDAIIKCGKPVIASTGGQGKNDVVEFLKYTNGQFTELTLLECVAKYPSPAELYNLNVLKVWLAYFHNVSVGISDHTLTNTTAVAAVGAGATVFEKHLDPFFGSGETPDSCVSISPGEFKLYVSDIHEAYSAMGDGNKQPRQQHEAQLRYRRRLIATKQVAAGEALKFGENFGIFRSLKDDTKGMSPHQYKDVDGKTVKVTLEVGDSIGPRDIE